MKLRRITTLAILLFTSTSLVIAFSGGPPNARTGAPLIGGGNELNCTQCHSGTVNSGGGTLTVSAPGTYVPGDTVLVDIDLAQTGQFRWGFEITALDSALAPFGTFVTVDPTRTQIDTDGSTGREYAKHTSAGTDAGTPDAAPGWTVGWVAPLTSGGGPVTFYAAGNAANGNGANSGDFIYTTSQSVSEGAGAPCCIGVVGDANCDGSVGLPDLSTLIDNLFITFSPLCCDEEADLNTDGSVGLPDLSTLIDHLFITFSPLAQCPVTTPEPAGRLVILNQADTTIYIYDSETLIRTDSFATPVVEPHFIRSDANDQYYYIVGRQVGGSLAKYDVATDALIANPTVQGTHFPTALVSSASGDTLFVTDFTNASGRTHRYDVSGTNFSFIDSTLFAGIQTHDIDISPDGDYVVSAGFGSDDITVFNTATGTVTPLTIDSALQQFNPPSSTYGPYGVFIDNTGDTAIIACSKGTDQIRLFDLTTLSFVDSILVPVSNAMNPGRNGPTYMTMSPDNTKLFLTNHFEPTMVVIDLPSRTIIETIDFSVPRPFGITRSDDGSRIYVSCTNVRTTGPGAFYVIDGTTYAKIDSVTVGREPFGIEWQPNP